MTAVDLGPPGTPQAPPRPRFTQLLAAERIKLASTRSPWWCGGIVVALLVGLAALVMAFWEPTDGPAWAAIGGLGNLSLAVVVVLATLSVTGEYRFGTIRATFQAVPNRAAALLAKAVVVAAAVALLGLVVGFGVWGVAQLVAPEADLALVTEAHWRGVAGMAPVYVVIAVLAIGVGLLVRHTAGAISILLVWLFVAETVLAVLPRIGQHVEPWLPFTNLARFLTVGIVEPNPLRSFFGERALFGPWAALAYAAAVAVGVLALGIAVARRRDA